MNSLCSVNTVSRYRSVSKMCVCMGVVGGVGGVTIVILMGGGAAALESCLTVNRLLV